MNEKRELKAFVKNPGGNASKNSISVTVQIPASFARDMHITKESRDVIVEYNFTKKEITIKKNEKT